ncbi:MAG: hypothetical protein K8R68_10070 [Bacteroidales bacterium]|nr:hypothetical protein [Bacteroidales bacterium]
MNKTEIKRKKFKPVTIRILFIAESPPVGGTFFYNENSNLFYAVKLGFEKVFGAFKSTSGIISKYAT